MCHRNGTERPSPSPKPGLLSLLFITVTICPHLWMDRSMAHQRQAWMQRGPLLAFPGWSDGKKAAELQSGAARTLTNSCGPASEAEPNSASLELARNCISEGSQDPSGALGLQSSPHFEKQESKTCCFSSRIHLRGGKLSIVCPR